jgi:hypothetical protein
MNQSDLDKFETWQEYEDYLDLLDNRRQYSDGLSWKAVLIMGASCLLVVSVIDVLVNHFLALSR